MTQYPGIIGIDSAGFFFGGGSLCAITLGLPGILLETLCKPHGDGREERSLQLRSTFKERILPASAVQGVPS